MINPNGSTSTRTRVQGIAASNFLATIYPSDLTSVLQRRLRRILGPVFDSGSLDPALIVLKTLRPFEVMQVIKTWSNAWATSHRFHESGRLPCLMGCPDEPDSLDHYASCVRMESIIVQCFNSLAPSLSCTGDSGSSELGSLCRMWRGTSMLGLDDPSRFNLRCIACMFYAYHAVKFKHEVNAACSDHSSLDFTALQCSFAGAFMAALRFA